MSDLETRLARSRSALLDEIDQPPLAEVRRRANRIRRRRAAAAGAAALALIGVVGISARPWQQDTTPNVTATNPAPTAPVYQGGGIEITGLAPTPVWELPGEIADVEFADATHGLVAAGCDQDCPPLFRTSDGGHTWQPAPPDGVDGLLDLVAFPNGRWLLSAGGEFWSSANGEEWRKISRSTPTVRDRIEPGQLPRVDESGKVAVWSPEQGPVGLLRQQPDLTVRWVAPAAAGDDAWWVGGVVGTQPAVAVSHDSGRTWKTTSLSEPATLVDAVAVGTLGAEVYAVARNKAGEVLGIYHSVDGGGRFEPTYVSSGADGPKPGPFTGDPVPLLDGRLLLVVPRGTPSSWWVSEDAGSTFKPVLNLPAVGSIRRTYAGYVAYDLFGSNWAAFSTDGANWQKLQIY